MWLGSAKQIRATEDSTQQILLALKPYSLNEEGYKVDNRS